MDPRPIIRGAAVGRRGFTLLEVLVSMLLIAIILPVAMKGITLAVQTASLAKQRSEAVSLAQTQLADLVTGTTPTQSSIQGTFPDNPGYTWTADLTQWSGTTVEQLEVDVLWTSEGRQRSVALTTLLYTGSPTGGTGTGTNSNGGTAGP